MGGQHSSFAGERFADGAMRDGPVNIGHWPSMSQEVFFYKNNRYSPNNSSSTKTNKPSRKMIPFSSPTKKFLFNVPLFLEKQAGWTVPRRGPKNQYLPTYFNFIANNIGNQLSGSGHRVSRKSFRPHVQ